MNTVKKASAPLDLRALTERTEDPYQLSPMQQGMLFHSLCAQQSGVDIEQMVFTLHENLNVSAFEQAWQRVLERHPVLRTSFCWEGDSEPLQYEHQRVGLSLEQQDWCGLSAKDQEDRLQTYLQINRRHSFQLTEAPLMRFALFRVSESDYQFIWTFHHIILDGRSYIIVLKEVFAFYDAFCQGEDLQLEQPHPYRDHIQWLQQQDLSKAEGFWRHLLKGFTAPTPLVVDRAPKTGLEQGKSGWGEQEIRLSVASTSQLQSLAQQHQLTLNTLVQGAWALLLSRYSGEADVVFGATRACRRSSVAGAESMVGLLINTLPVLVSISPEVPLLLWLQALRAQWITLQDYEHTPLVKIQEWSDIPHGTSLFDSILVFENYSLNSKLRSQGGRWENLEVELVEQTNYPLTLLGYAEPELLLKIKYDRQRFDDATIVRVLGHIKTLLESMATNPWQCLAELQLLTPDERHQLLVEWNDTEAEYSQDVCIHQLFEAQVKRTPNAIAVVFETQQLTYQELNCQANQLAHYLKSLGVGPGKFVGVYMDRTLEMIPALLGILKAGGAYVPLETNFPKARIQWVLSSLNVCWLVTQQLHLQTFDELQPQLPTLKHLICLDAATVRETAKQEAGQNLPAPLQVWRHSHLCQQPESNLPRQSSPDDTAYIIFTSGSTGTPKGVVVRHKPVINLIEWVNKTFSVNASDRVLFITSLSFDLSVYDIFGLLAAGGSIRVVTSQDVREPLALLHILCNEPITFWDSAPPALQQLVPFFPDVKLRGWQRPLRLVFMSGDWIPVMLPDLSKSTFPGVEIISLGGATEATIWSNFYPIGEVDPTWTSIPYGRPIQNAQYYILDSHDNPCPVGVPGELYIGGECLASGYTDPAKTAERFIPSPFDKPGACLYRTGDLARFLPDSNIQFLGRIDDQVKIRGFRIELGEIEAALSHHPAVRENAVLAREDQLGNKRLVAYLAPEQGKSLTTSDLRSFVKERLPEYMVPSVFVLLEALPLTPNGKVDRRALPTPDQARPEQEKSFVAPQDPLELQLTKIWQEVLGIQPIGVRDNFFDLGGHSLLAVRLIAQVEKAFSKNLRLTTLLQSPTIEQLANTLRSSGCNTPVGSLVPLKLGGDKPPLFCIYGILLYHDLARNLDPEQPVYGVYIQDEVDLLQAGRLEKQLSTLISVAEQATRYLKEIRTLQPKGPYFLAGESFGGLVAFEMAQQLHMQGEKVALLALLDTQSPLSAKKKLLWHQWVSLHLKSLLVEGSTYALKKLDQRISSGKNRLSIVSRIYRKFDLRSGRSFRSYLQEVAQLDVRQQVRDQALRNYIPSPYPGKVILFRAMERDQFEADDTDPQFGWGELAAGGLEVHHVPGDHIGILKEPHVRIMATKLIANLQPDG